ncbi:MAG: hypothetical protein WA622_26780 [Mycobacterium sp.]|uniref:PPW family C-terminal domain-containing PPE protein n=1 Tax=Mycobacterium sp. TaxID=1785 RepID=UPI003BB54C00
MYPAPSAGRTHRDRRRPLRGTIDDRPDLDGRAPGAGSLGFSGTAGKVSAGTATGLATLADDDFGSGPRMPMMPSTWGPDSPDEGDKS